MSSRLKLEPGAPSPLGATWDGRGVNFALFSENAEKVELCLFDGGGKRETDRIVLPEYTNQVWHGYVTGLQPEQLYGYRVSGPYDPRQGHRFNPNKLLLDPYARAIDGPLILNDAMFGYRRGSHDDLSFDRRDSARVMPKCRIVEPAFTWGPEQHPKRPWPQSVVYELHVRGFTKRHPDVPDAERGTFAGLGHPAVVDYLAKLGITAVELLPVHTIVDEPHLTEAGLHNYWGYNSVNFFSADHRLHSRRAAKEFKTMVANLHNAGIEVILDVVYNHSGEGDEFGPTVSFRGIDNAAYYWLQDDRRRYMDFTGTGNSLNLTHPRVLQMVMDSLRYWVQEMHVDGFRFDLTTTLGRERNGYDAGSGFLDAVTQDPVLAHAKLIAEPWDVGMGGYQVGGFPPGWAEWNDKFRDAVRRFWRGDTPVVGDLASRLSGSSDAFQHKGRRPWSSVNFVTAHDGFTLRDLVSYNQKHNEANNEGNRDGTDNNYSWNCGVEGPTDDTGVRDLRQRQLRNMLTTLLLSQGTPMVVGGDEFGRTQHGNNNAYCQDNDIGWVDWEARTDEDRALAEFVRGLLGLRRDHRVFRRANFFTGDMIDDVGLRDVTWLSPEGHEMRPEDWDQPGARCLGMEMFRPGGDDGDSDRANQHMLLLFNANDGSVEFKLPEAKLGGAWTVLLDTRNPDITGGKQVDGGSYVLIDRSAALLRDL